MTEAGLALVEAARTSGLWEGEPRPQVSERPCPEFRDALASDRSAAAHFDGLTPAQQKQFIVWINVAKQPETRERRIAEAIGLLQRGEKLGLR